MWRQSLGVPELHRLCPWQCEMADTRWALPPAEGSVGSCMARRDPSQPISAHQTQPLPCCLTDAVLALPNNFGVT